MTLRCMVAAGSATENCDEHVMSQAHKSSADKRKGPVGAKQAGQVLVCIVRRRIQPTKAGTRLLQKLLIGIRRKRLLDGGLGVLRQEHVVLRSKSQKRNMKAAASAHLDVCAICPGKCALTTHLATAAERKRLETRACHQQQRHRTRKRQRWR